MQIFPETLIKIWTGWEMRALVMLSLSLQIILILFGSRRKHTAAVGIRFLAWSAYMSADWVATVALGNLATLGGDSGNNSSKQINPLQSFWAPFLLLHLGGPDTITAYSLEDNELWQRHFLGLFVEVGVAFYVFLRSWGDTALTLIAIPVFIAGIIKYGERTWVLRSSSAEHFRNSLLPDPDPGPDYVERTRDGRYPGEVNESPPGEREIDCLTQAYHLFKKSEYLFADLILGYYERKDCRSIICRKSPEQAFGIVEVELGFLYDVLYTKARLVYCWFGILLRCTSSLCSISAFLTFVIRIDYHAYAPTDIFITYLLLVVAVVLELYALIILISSDWTKLWLVKHKKLAVQQVRNGERWSGILAKYNLINICLKEKSFCIPNKIMRHLNVIWQHVDSELQKLIFDKVGERSKDIDNLFNVSSCKKLLDYRGDYVLKKMNCHDLFEWSTIAVEFDHSLLLWHIATELCYYDDVKRLRELNDLNGLISLKAKSKISKCLSDYMLYLLVICSKMLPKGIGEIRYRDTCAEARRFFEQRKNIIQSKADKACEELLQVDTSKKPEDVKGDISKSVLFYGCRLAKQLQSVKPPGQEEWGLEQKWEMINEVWVELLAYAAVHCSWKEHAQRLRKGGELLSHVCLLMAHHGLSEQYQTQKQYIQARREQERITMRRISIS